PSPPEVFARMYKHREFDAAEMGLTFYLILVARGEAPFTAIPVFPSRMFRHGFIFVHTRAGIRDPRELEGKRIGVPEYRQTAAVWIRGMLQHEYGVNPAKVRWVEGGLETPRRSDELSILPGNDISVEVLNERASLNDLLLRGELDGFLGARVPSCFGRSPDIQRLFPDYRAAERAYYEKTRLFPIMHTLVIRNDLLRDEPWVAQSLYQACCRAKALCWQELQFTGAARVMLPWLIADLEEARAVLGEDPWPYGVKANRHALEAVAGYLVEQGLAPRPVAVDELFPPGMAESYY
ncbi:MAG: ABC transporter substrate-binding protein, partial [Deltaproteobacteria bacterium]|nr:ABC transporter substrate-binding protein [Deltaproteobacteria bacterium]